MAPLHYLPALLFTCFTLTLWAQGEGKDTTVIFSHKVEGQDETIFIDYRPGSEYYDAISHFRFIYYDNESYSSSLDYLRENEVALTRKKPLLPWTNWVMLQQYKGAFYAYHPCDFLFHFRQSVNDTTFIDWTGEGPFANKILEQEKIDERTYAYTLTGIGSGKREIIIHLVDLSKGIAVFEELADGLSPTYRLMIAAEKIKSVPIIVNHCPVQKESELEFEKPDFSRLLATPK